MNRGPSTLLVQHGRLQLAPRGDDRQDIVAPASIGDAHGGGVSPHAPGATGAGADTDAGLVLKGDIRADPLGQALDFREFDLQKGLDLGRILLHGPITGLLVAQIERPQVQAHRRFRHPNPEPSLQQLHQNLSGPQHRVVAVVHRRRPQHGFPQPPPQARRDRARCARRRPGVQRRFAPRPIPPQPVVNAAATDPENLGDQFRTAVLFLHRPYRDAAQIIHHLVGNLACIG